MKARLWPPPAWLGFLWGFAEGTLFFLIPDILLSWAALGSGRGGVRMLGAILAGSLAAGFLMYGWAAARPAASRAVVAAVPFVRPGMFARVEADYQTHGAAGMLMGPGSGIPYKVYAVLAPPVCGPLAFGLMSIPARLERLALSWLVATALGWLARRWIGAHPRLTLAAFAAFWTATYAVYWTRI